MKRIAGDRDGGCNPKIMGFYFNIGHDMGLVFQEENALSYISIKLQNVLIGNI